jgi:hypothetical protein
MNLFYYSNMWFGPQNTFIATYKDMHKLGLGGEFFWKSKNFESGLNFEYNSYKNRDSSTVYNFAPFELNAYGRYNWRERIIFGASLHFKSKTPTLYHFDPFSTSANPDNEFISSFTMVNIDLSYVYNRKFTFYLKLNNILNTNEINYLYYSSPGFGAGLGAIIKL